MNTTNFNAIQQQIIDLIPYIESEEALSEIQDILSNYFAQKAEKEIDKLWDNKEIDNTVIERWKYGHMWWLMVTDSPLQRGVSYHQPLYAHTPRKQEKNRQHLAFRQQNPPPT